MMAKIDGIGGVFIFSNYPKDLAEWYINKLGLTLKLLEGNIYYVELYFRSLDDPNKKLHIVFAIMPISEHQDINHNQAMINYRVDDLVKFVEELKIKGISVDPIHEGEDAEGIGKFTHLYDPEGNKIELWQPSTGI